MDNAEENLSAKERFKNASKRKTKKSKSRKALAKLRKSRDNGDEEVDSCVELDDDGNAIMSIGKKKKVPP